MDACMVKRVLPRLDPRSRRLQAMTSGAANQGRGPGTGAISTGPLRNAPPRGVWMVTGLVPSIVARLVPGEGVRAMAPEKRKTMLGIT